MLFMFIFAREGLELPKLPRSKTHQPANLGLAATGRQKHQVRPFKVLLIRKGGFGRNCLRKVVK